MNFRSKSGTRLPEVQFTSMIDVVFLLLVYFGSAVGYIGFAVLAAAWAASIYMKRHTHAQMVAGGLIPFAALGLVTAALAALG